MIEESLTLDLLLMARQLDQHILDIFGGNAGGLR